MVQQAVTAISLRCLLVLSMLASVVASALALDPVVVAQQTIRQMVRVHFGLNTPTVFTSDSTTSLGSNEVQVSGDGYIPIGNGRREFRYRMRVNRTTTETRQARMEFRDGQVITGRNDWDRPEVGNHYVDFLQPRSGARVRAGRVQFAGTADGGRIELRVSRRGSRPFYTQQHRVGNGRWFADVDIDSRGDHEAQVQLLGTRERDEVRFSIVNGGWNGFSGGDARITIPRAGQRVPMGVVQFGGEYRGGRVDFEIARSGQRPFFSRSIDVNNNRWFVDVNILDDGRHMARVRGDRSDRWNQVTFVVGGSGSWGDARFETPRNGSTLRSGRVQFGGRSEGSEVELQVALAGKRPFFNKRIGADRGRWYADVTCDQPGEYIATVRSLGSNRRDSIRFRIRR